MHEVEALVAKIDSLAAGVHQFKSAILCPLAQSFALLPVTEALAKELVAHRTEAKAAADKPIQQISDALQNLAVDISRSSPVVYINTYYFGGRGGQDALVWDKGSLMFSPTTQGYNQVWPNSPISQALRIIGVVAEPGMDEFDTVGLGRHRETHRWAKPPK